MRGLMVALMRALGRGGGFGHFSFSLLRFLATPLLSPARFASKQTGFSDQ
jgi:hypothetical protein